MKILSFHMKVYVKKLHDANHIGNLGLSMCRFSVTFVENLKFEKDGEDEMTMCT